MKANMIAAPRSGEPVPTASTIMAWVTPQGMNIVSVPRNNGVATVLALFFA